MFNCYNHYRSGESHITHQDNVTKVADWRCEDDPDYSAGGIAPYSRPVVVASLPSCAGSYDCPDEGHPCGRVKCGPWPLDERATNVWTEVGFDNLARCRKLGFKVVQAKKSWHGRFGFLSHDPGGISGRPMGVDCSDCGFESEQPSPDTTKFLTVRREVTVNWSCLDFSDDSIHSGTQHEIRQFSVDRWSGVKTRDACTYSNSNPTPTCDEGGPMTDEDLVNLLSGSMMPDSDTAGGPLITTGSSFDAKWADSYSPGTGETVSKSATNTEVDLYYKSIFTLDSRVVLEVTVSWKLSNPYTSADAHDDAVGLAAMIDLADDSKYPWRTDAFTTIAPIVSYNEAEPTSPDVGSDLDCGSYTDPNAAIYDGTVRGVLLDAGKHGFFDYEHRIWNTCVDGETGCTWYQASYGAMSGGGVEPYTATQWTDKFTACELWPYAWAAMAGSHGGGPNEFPLHTPDTVPNGFAYGNGVIALQKWAEIKQPFHRFNTSRPCGADQATIDMDTVVCVESVAGSTLTLTSAPAVAFTRPGMVGVSGFPDGIYDVSMIDPTHYTVTGGYVAKSFDGVGVGIIGEIRFEDADDDCTDDFYLPSEGKSVHVEWAHNFRDFLERDRVIAQYAVCGNCDDAEPGDLTPIRPDLHGMPRSVYSFAQYQHATTPSACYPTVLCISPNYPAIDNFDSQGGITTPFPASPFPGGADCRYGSLWQAEIIQMLSDPYWQAPKECDGENHPVSIAVDCPPVIEATTSPGWLTVEDLGDPDPPDGNVLPPPELVGYAFDCTPEPKATEGLPWTRLLNDCDDLSKDAWTAP